MAEKGSFHQLPLESILVGEPLPGAVYLHIDGRYITFRPKDDAITTALYDRLLFKKVKNLFIKKEDKPAFEKWISKQEKEDLPLQKFQNHPDLEGLQDARAEVKRKMLDIFQGQNPEVALAEVMDNSKKLVLEVARNPLAVKSLSQLQTYSRGSVDHSVNVSILSTYLALQMGYSHQLILQHVGMGALLHDVGKGVIKIEDSDSPDEVETKMLKHPEAGLKFLEAQTKVPKEVLMIVEQHHEAYDGTGFPNKLKGAAIYDLARVVSIANQFDKIVANEKGSLQERQRLAIRELDEVLYRKFDPMKLEKALKILRLGV